MEVVGDIWRGDGGSRPGCLAEAKRYHRDFGLSAWVSDQNEGKAVAPTPQMIIRRLRTMAADREPFAQSSALRLDNNENSNKWVLRWRHRWGLRFGSYAVRDQMSAVEKQGKARRQAVPFWGPSACFAGPFALFVFARVAFSGPFLLAP